MNERGERVLDTLVKVDDSMIAVKSGLRTHLKNLGKAKGPTLEKVRAKVLEMIRGRVVIGYHIYLKLTDLGVWGQMLTEDFDKVHKPIDCSVMFNRSISEPQQQMKTVCKEHLNLLFAKRPFPYAVDISIFIDLIAH